MKNQYFGDNRDLFKYDLILHIIQAGLVEHFTFIPMLTEDDGKGHGDEDNRDKAKAGTENKELKDFLNKCRMEDRRNIKELERFFKEKGIGMIIYRRDEYFYHEKRQEYFKQIEDEILSKSLVFVDPDTGLQVERSREKHFRYAEVRNLYERMDKSSILMIYQHFPRNEKHKEYLGRRSSELGKCVGDKSIYISDNQIVFFLSTKNAVLKEAVGRIISNYEKFYPSLFSSLTQI